MSKKILSFTGSNSKNSINDKLVSYVDSQLTDYQVKHIYIHDFESPIYSIDRQTEEGFPENITKFVSLLEEADGFVVSLAEHNGIFSVALKNLLDWASRIDRNIFKDKAMLLMGTSPGPNGATNAIKFAANSFPFFGAKISDTFSLPSFQDNFVEGKITNAELDSDLKSKVENFKKAL